MKFNQLSSVLECVFATDEYYIHNQRPACTVAKRHLKLVFHAYVAHDVNRVGEIYRGHFFCE